MKPVKHAIAFVVYNEDRSRFLAVKRPDDDEDLPNAWGLPAGSLKKGETPVQAVLRSGREKLGVELKTGRLIGEGSIEREGYVLHMREYEVEIVKGEPRVPQPVPDVTQYMALKWATPDDLLESAKLGSLCSMLFLASLKKGW
jgi:8-oxo-dGTP pyrophosphatase MutT (NUDIX family)